MQPSIGRIVHYQDPDGGTFPAVIVTVLKEECRLFIFNEAGYFCKQAPFSETPKPGHWSWPPKSVLR